MQKRYIATFILAAILAVNVLAAVVTRQATSNQTPDATLGGLAVTGATNTGHDSTTASITGPGAETKSCRWFNFQSVSGQIKSIKLKFDWAESGTLSAGSNSFTVSYSVDGGTGWTNQVSHTNITASNNGSEEVTLNVTQNLTQVQIRDQLVASASSGQSASVTASVSNIRIEVTTYDAQVIVMW